MINTYTIALPPKKVCIITQ